MPLIVIFSVSLDFFAYVTFEYVPSNISGIMCILYVNYGM